MKPDFALTLSFEGISLLRRVPGGWARIGDVALDAADLRAALAGLRGEADGYSPHGGEVKLVVPNEQIKYLSLPDTGLRGEALRDHIRAALDGATPYAVDDLTFDWDIRDGSLHVAAVANETLDEAEAFAKSHHFDPVSYVAIPPEGSFAGEVFFGPAASWTGAAPDREARPIVVVDAPEEEDETAVAQAPVPLFEDLVDEAEAQIDIETQTAVTVAMDDTADDEEALSPAAAVEDDMDASPPEIATPPDQAESQPAFSSIRATRETPAPAAAPPVAPPPAVGGPAKPRLQLGGARKSTRDSDVTAPGLQVETAEEPAERKGFGFFSQRKPKSTPARTDRKPAIAARVHPPVSGGAEKAPVKHDPAPARAAVARIAAMRAGRATETPAAPDSAAATAISDERQRMTIFGARTEPQVGGKPRFLGLMLTSALLVVLLAVAAWASVYLDEGLSRFFDTRDDTPSIARLPEVDLEPLDGSVTDFEESDDRIELAALETGDAVTPDTALAPVLPPPAALTPEEAAATYAATGIWQKSPESPSVPPMTTLDDLYVASIDARVEQFDAVALPSAEALRNDQTYLSLPDPALPGTRYTLDERGLVIASPEGTINPEGVRVFAGLPPVVPPIRPAPPAVEAPAEAETGLSPEIAALQAFRPRLRPGGLIEGNERAQLAGRTRAELQALRPTARPETLKAEAEEAQPEATKFAVVQSSQPVTRPRNFASIVERARAAQPAPQPGTTQVASAAAVATVQPRIPSSASVAREATVSNAINLRRINLIGVYGKPSNRRALVRLANGRYQKVEVGDRLDGGRVAAIGNSELRYTKNGRNVVLDMPDG